METFLANFITDMIGRVDGPLQFRIYIQPLMAIALAIRDGYSDVRERRPPYGWALAHDPAHRLYLMREGWKGISRVFILAYALDLLYQYVVLRGWRPLEAFFAATVLALIPYVLLRGPANRAISAIHDKRAS